MALCLSRTEIAEFTRSRTRAGQVAMLVKNGIRHSLDLHGWPVVTRSAVESVPDQAQAAPTWKSNKAA